MSYGLVPGFIQVGSFEEDHHVYEDEEEVEYVTMDLGTIEPTLLPSSATYRLLGLDTPTPFLQLSGTVLKGRYDSLLGTELVFSEPSEAREWNKRAVQYFAKTQKRIQFKPVELIAKTTEQEESGKPIAGPSKRGANLNFGLDQIAGIRQRAASQSEDRNAEKDEDVNSNHSEEMTLIEDPTQLDKHASKPRKSKRVRRTKDTEND